MIGKASGYIYWLDNPFGLCFVPHKIYAVINFITVHPFNQHGLYNIEKLNGFTWLGIYVKNSENQLLYLKVMTIPESYVFHPGHICQKYHCVDPNCYIDSPSFEWKKKMHIFPRDKKIEKNSCGVNFQFMPLFPLHNLERRL